MVNGLTFESVRLRRTCGSGDFDILIDDPQIGRFALTAAVPDLELRDEDSDWRQVTLDELKKILADDGELAEAAERESFNRLVAEGEHSGMRRSPYIEQASRFSSFHSSKTSSRAAFS